MKYGIMVRMCLVLACCAAAVASPASAQPAPVASAMDADAEILARTLQRARAERLDTLPIGEIVARLGAGFVGAPYTPGTLDRPGEERLVVNLREFDCVTFVESMLAMARLVRSGEDGLDAFRRELTRVRYRDGVIAGYPSRLHYFSDWIADNQRREVVADVTRDLGGVADGAVVNFMSTHADLYRHLHTGSGEPAVGDNLDAVRAAERRLSATPRFYVPESAIAAAAAGIRNGDVIAATSTVPGLDVAHTGIALWVDGRLHLLHAPLVGRSVEISTTPLAERIIELKGQDGIMVARPR